MPSTRCFFDSRSCKVAALFRSRGSELMYSELGEVDSSFVKGDDAESDVGGVTDAALISPSSSTSKPDRSFEKRWRASMAGETVLGGQSQWWM